MPTFLCHICNNDKLNSNLPLIKSLDHLVRTTRFLLLVTSECHKHIGAKSTRIHASDNNCIGYEVVERSLPYVA